MGPLTLVDRIARGRAAIARARAEGRDTREWEAHLAKLENVTAREGTAHARVPFALAIPATVDALLRRTWPPLPDPWRPTTDAVLAYWTTCPSAPRSRWPLGERGPMMPPAR